MARISKRLRFEVFRRDNHTCRYCGRSAPEVRLNADHVVPESLGGPTDPSNLVTACADCNGGKSSVPPNAAMVQDVRQDALRWADAMRLAAEAYEAELELQDEQNAVFRSAWERWTFAGRPLALPGDWTATIKRLRAAGLTDAILADAVDTAMQARGVDDKFRYFCGVAWRKVADLREVAHQFLSEGGAQETRPTLERLISGTLDHVGAPLEPWIYDDLVLDLAARIRDHGYSHLLSESRGI